MMFFNCVGGKATWQNLCAFDRTLSGLPSIHCNVGSPSFVFVARALALSLYVVATPLLAQQAPYTPAPGSPERKAIFDAMRSIGEDRTRVFVVKYLKVADGWAWMSGDPQSPDGASHFETESALLHKDGNSWRVMAQPCGEGNCDWDSEMARIRKTFKQAPAGIFPSTEGASTEGASSGEAPSRRITECSLIVDGKSFISGPCDFSPRGGGSFMIMKGRRFAVVDVDPNQRNGAQGYWNENPLSYHAESELGTLERHDECWSNEHATVCAKE